MAQLLIPNPSTASPALQQMGASIQAGLNIGNQALQAAQMMNQRLQAEQKMLRDTFHQDRLFRFERQKEAFDQQVKSEQERRANALFGPQLTNLDLRNEQQAIELGYLPQDIESQLRSRDAGTESTQFLTETRRKREPFELMGFGQTIEGNASANRVAEATADDRITSSRVEAEKAQRELKEWTEQDEAQLNYYDGIRNSKTREEAEAVILKYAPNLDIRDREFGMELIRGKFPPEISADLDVYDMTTDERGNVTTRRVNAGLFGQRSGVGQRPLTREQVMSSLSKAQKDYDDLKENKASEELIATFKRQRDYYLDLSRQFDSDDFSKLFPGAAGNSSGSAGARRYLLPNQ